MGDKLIVSEGDGDAAFFRNLIRVYSLDGFSIYNRPKGGKIAPGVDAYEAILNSVNVATEFENVSLVLIVADCDSSPVNEFKRVVKQIRKSGDFPIPTKPREIATSAGQKSVCVLMLPWDNEAGSLETICYSLASRKRPSIAACIESFVNCVNATTWNPQQLSKLKLRCLLASSCPKDPNTGLPYAWDKGKKRPKELIPLNRKNKMITRVVEFLKNLP